MTRTGNAQSRAARDKEVDAEVLRLVAVGTAFGVCVNRIGPKGQTRAR